MTLAILLLGLVVATCFIAYIADNIGKNMGKKRVSLFGLRPRQTATLISMASSVLIMLATVGILMATSQSLSNALLRYDIEKAKANREREKLQSQNKDLQSNLDSQLGLIANQKKEIDQNRKLVADFSKQRETAESQLETANSKLKTARIGETKARAQTKQAQAQLVSARRQFQTFKTQLASAKAQVAAAKSRVASAQSQVASAQTKLQNEKKQVVSTQKELTGAQSELSSRLQQLQSAQLSLRAAVKQQQEAAENLRLAQEQVSLAQVAVKKSLEEREAFANDIAELQVRRDNLTKEVAAQRMRLAELTRQNQEIGETALQIAIGNIAIPVGEVFAVRTVPAGLSAGQVREELRALMKTGGEHLPNVPKPQTISLVKLAAAENLSDEEFLNGFASYLSTLKFPVSVRLLSARNHAPGEIEINAQIVPVIIRNIFENNEVLGSATIEAGSDATIFNQLLQLLNKTEARARERGATPLPTLENPLFYATGTNERVFEVLRQIQSRAGDMEVRLIAAEDISSIDSPRVRFEIAGSTSP